jgi:S-phase kinase-associated protein 1
MSLSMESPHVTIQIKDPKTKEVEYFQVSLEAASMNRTLHNIIDDTGASAPIPIPDGHMTPQTFAKVIEYCNFHSNPENNNAEKEQERRNFDSRFTSELGQIELFDVILAANYLDNKPLLDLTCQKVANMIKGKTPEEIRAVFNIPNDFNADEERQVREENQWAFE